METIQIINPQLNKAKYTTLLKDIDTEVLDRIADVMGDFNTENELFDMFMSKYRYYEICDKDEEVFLQCVTDVYNEHVQYYTELMTNYTKEYDYATGNKKTMSRTDTTESNKNGTVDAENNSTHRE